LIVLEIGALGEIRTPDLMVRRDDLSQEGFDTLYSKNKDFVNFYGRFFFEKRLSLKAYVANPRSAQGFYKILNK